MKVSQNKDINKIKCQKIIILTYKQSHLLLILVNIHNNLTQINYYSKKSRNQDIFFLDSKLMVH